MCSGMNLYVNVVIITTAVKLLLIPSYKSTDFEVHRNWLAITNSLPLHQWYIDETSPWTLDYPPFFAWFEFLLSKIAVLFDSEMLKVENLDHSNHATVLFQRLSVMVMDLVIIGATGFAASRAQLSPREKIWFFAVVLCNAGLLMVDHIHFQYNGFLIGVLLWSVLCIEQEQCLISAILFSVLLNLKHLFLYSAPLYFAYLLKQYCLKNRVDPVFAFCRLGACVILVFGASFGPLIWYGHLRQILTRLFPFGRGLCHAYWAPNIWALYAFIDKILSLILSSSGQPTTTSGLVGAWKFAVLPEISPPLSLILVLIFASLPAILQFSKPHSQTFMESVAYANLCGFMWGYHVHEKAILPVLIPLLFVAFRRNEESVMDHTDHVLFFSTMSHYSLTPLLFQPQEYPIKFLLLLSYALLVSLAVENTRNHDERDPRNTVQKLEVQGKRILILALFCVELSQLGMICFKFQTRFEFLPLMLISILSSIWMTYYWIKWTLAFLNTLFNISEKSKRN